MPTLSWTALVDHEHPQKSLPLYQAHTPQLQSSRAPFRGGLLEAAHMWEVEVQAWGREATIVLSQLSPPLVLWKSEQGHGILPHALAAGLLD